MNRKEVNEYADQLLSGLCGLPQDRELQRKILTAAVRKLGKLKDMNATSTDEAAE